MSSFVTAGGDIGNGELLAQNAQDTANDANKKNSANSQQIANINDPNYLTPFEKPQLEIQMDSFATIYAADKDIATSESIDFTAYEVAYQAYVAYMTPLVADISAYSPINRDTYNSMVTAVQDQQKALDSATKAQYDTAINQAKTDIANGQAQYQTMQIDAANMKSDAANVATTASQAIASAGFANDTANAAQSSAMAAVNQAGFASDTSLQASQAASSAVAAANEATAGATTAESNAANALTSAATVFNATAKAQSTADNAFSQAQAVGSQASAEIAVQSNATAKAQSTADNAFSQAQAVGSQASAEINSNSTATAKAQSTADNAFSQATTAIDNGKVTSQAVTNLKGGSKLTIAELENGLATKVANSEYASYKAQTASQIGQLVTDGAFSAYQTQTADLIASKVATKDFSAYQATTAKAISSKVESSDFNTYKSQTADAISSKVSSIDFNNLGGGRNYLLNSKLITITPTGQANYDYRIYLSDDFWKNPDRIKPNNIRVSFNMHTEKALTAEFDSTVYFGASPYYGKSIIYPAGTTESQKYELTYSIADPAYTTNNLFIRFQAKDTADFPFIIENAVLSIGSNFPDWSPAPEDLATVTALTQVKQTADSLQTDISKKIEKTDLNGYATQDWAQNQIKLTADGINGTISSIKGTVDSQTTSINDLKADSSSFKSQFTTVNDTLGKHTTDISTLQTDSSGFKTQFQTVNDNVGKNATDIGTLQASSKELTTGFNTLTTDNGTNKNDISQLKQTSKEVSSTLETVQTQVQNSAVGTNLLLKTYESFGMTGNNTVNQTQPMYALSRRLEAGTTVTLSFDAVSTAPASFGILSNGSDGGAWTTYIHDTVDTTARHCVGTIAPTNFSDLGITMRLDNVPSTTTITVSNVKLEIGYNATDYSTNPLDNATVTAVSKLSQTVDGINGTMSSVKSTVDGQTTSINDLKADSSSFKSQFMTVNDTLGKNTTDIGTLQTDSNGFKAQFQTVNDTIGKQTTDIGSLQVTANGLQSTVSDKASSDQLTLLSDQLTNKISDLSSSTSSQFTQTFKDINGLVKKGDVVNQFNLDAGGILLDTSGSTAKIILSSNNIELDSANPVVMGSANITNLLTSKTIEASSITSTTKIIGSDIQAAMIHSADNSFSLNGATGDIIGASIQSSDGTWGITANGKISGASVTSSLIDISGDGSGPNFDAENVTPDTATGIYSRYKYTNPNVGFDVNGMGRKMYKNGYLVINGDTFLNRTIGDWSADGGGKYVYDTMYEANVIKMRAYNYTGSNVQTDDPSKTQGVISSRLDIQPSAITMGPNFSVGNPNILIDYTGRIKGGLIAANAAHSIGTTDGGDLYFMQMNKDATNVGGSSIPIHVKKLYESSLLSLKTDIKPIDPHEALAEVVKNDVMGYHFKNDKTTDPKSVSVILDDINPIPKYYTSDIFKSADGTGRNDGNIVGYLMLSIKDLNSRLQKLEGAN